MKQRIRAHPFNERNMDKNFHDRRQEKTAHADIKYGGDAPETVSKPPGRPSRPESEDTILIMALAGMTASSDTSKGMLACTEG